MTLSTPPEQCPACDSTNIDIDTELTAGICKDCNLVLDEKGNFLLPPSQPDDQPAEQVNLKDRGSNGRGTTNDWITQVNVKDASDQRLVDALTRIDSVTHDLQVEEEVRIRAAELVTDAWEQRFMHGRCKDATVGASVYIAGRESGRVRPISAVAESVSMSASKLQSTYRSLLSELDLHLKPAKPAEYISYLGNQLGVNHETSTVAMQYLTNLTEVAGNPVGIAVASLYLAAHHCEDSVTLADAGQAAGVTKETVWRKVEDIRESDFITSS